jgi:two-component system, cell cycle sensor histidine kinase and response regulator CckA
MTTTISLEELLRQALDRLARQERRTEALEAALACPTSRRQMSSPSTETPLEIPWPVRVPPRPSDSHAARVKELEARLAEAEDRLRLAGRLETVGRLVAGVAHDFNNLLAVITGSADVIRSGLPVAHPLRETAEQIATTAHTAAGVTRQLLTLGKPAGPCSLDPNAAVRALGRTLGQLTGRHVTLELALAPAVPAVQVDPGQFDQVVLNLVANARDAIPDSGTVTVGTAAAVVPANRPGWPSDVPPGQFVALTVADTGTGMTDEVKARAFDPFFTTKGARGTGLGLATVRDVVRAAGGHVEVESAVGRGTRIHVYWPVGAGARPTWSPAPEGTP